MEWQPIETAPMHGTSILVCGGEWLDQSETYPQRQPLTAPVIAYFIEFEGWFMGNSEAYGEYLIAFPTHWMPLPPPPVSA